MTRSHSAVTMGSSTSVAVWNISTLSDRMSRPLEADAETDEDDDNDDDDGDDGDNDGDNVAAADEVGGYNAAATPPSSYPSSLSLSS